MVGVQQHALLVLGHQGAHRHLSRNVRLNDWLTEFLCFWPLLIGLGAFRWFHFRHHMYLNTLRDPELVAKRLTPSRWRPDANRLWLFATDLVGGGVRDALLTQWFFRPTRWRDALGPAATALIWLFLPWQAAAIWFAAVYTSLWAVFRQRAYTEHVGGGTQRLGEPALWRRVLYLQERTWKHWEHHREPTKRYALL